MDSKAAGKLNIEMLLRRSKLEEGFGPEDDYAMGFLEGQKNAEYQRKILADYLHGLISIAASRGEMNSLAYARYILKRMGYGK
jgi:hypothetical protein